MVKKIETKEIIELKDTNWVIKIPITLWWIGSILGIIAYFFIIMIAIATL